MKLENRFHTFVYFFMSHLSRDWLGFRFFTQNFVPASHLSPVQSLLGLPLNNLESIFFKNVFSSFVISCKLI